MTADEAWDAAVDTACEKAMAIQAGFRRLLKNARRELTKDPMKQTASIGELYAQIDQGEALVGALGDVIRNIAAMKGNRPR